MLYSWKIVQALCVCIGLFPTLSCADEQPLSPKSNAEPAIQSYRAFDDDTDHLLGTLRLNEHYASFSHLRGHLDLEFVEFAPDFHESNISNARIYRIKNADMFYKENEHSNPYCDMQAFFIGIRTLTSRGPYKYPDRSVRLSFITATDVKKLKPSSACSAQSFLQDDEAETK